MPLRFATEPANGASAAREGLNRLSARENPLSARGVDFSTLELSLPHAVYDLRADQVANGGGLASATLTGFRYLVQGGGEAVAAAEVHVDDLGSARLVNLNYGPFVEATFRALQTVTTLAPVKEASYEVRLLRFAAIALMALWLKPETAGDDIIYALGPAPPGIDAERPYTANAFFDVILPLAQRRASKGERNAVP